MPSMLTNYYLYYNYNVIIHNYRRRISFLYNAISSLLSNPWFKYQNCFFFINHNMKKNYINKSYIS